MLLKCWQVKTGVKSSFFDDPTLIRRPISREFPRISAKILSSWCVHWHSTNLTYRTIYYILYQSASFLDATLLRLRHGGSPKIISCQIKWLSLSHCLLIDYWTTLMRSWNGQWSRGGVCISLYSKSIHWIPSKYRFWLYFNVSVNLTFDKTLMAQFCIFLCAKIATFGAIKCVSIQNSIWILFRSHSSTLMHTQLTASIALHRHSWMHAAAVFISNFEYPIVKVGRRLCSDGQKLPRYSVSCPSLEAHSRREGREWDRYCGSYRCSGSAVKSIFRPPPRRLSENRTEYISGQQQQQQQ